MNRRNFFRYLGLTGASAFGASMLEARSKGIIDPHDEALQREIEARYTATSEAEAFHKESIVIDLHADTFLWVELLGYDIAKRHEPTLPCNPLFNHLDLPRMEDGGMTAQGFGIVSAPTARLNTFAKLQAKLDLIEADILRNRDQLELATKAEHIVSCHERGKMAAFLGIEGAHCLEGKIDNLLYAYERGVRYLSFTHFTRNAFGSPSTTDGTHDDEGLTTLGFEAVEKMNELGMMIDVAHVSDAGLRDVLMQSRAPIIDTHAGALALQDSHRNLDDEQIRAIADSGGVVGVIFYPLYLCGNLIESVDIVIEHIKYIINVGGIDCIALGSDFDGFIASVPLGLKDVSHLPILTDLLWQANFTDAQIRKILGENVLRVFEDVCG